MDDVKDFDATERVHFTESGLIRRSISVLDHWINVPSLYLESATADVHLLSEGDYFSHPIPAHKALLTAGSEVFRSVFALPKGCGYFQMKDKDFIVTSQGVQAFLQLFYLKEIQITSRDFAEIYKLAHKFKVPKWKELCEYFMKHTLTVSTIIPTLELSDKFNLDEIKELCGKKLRRKSKRFFSSNEFIDCNHAVLEHIIDCMYFDYNVFKALLEWARKSCERRNIDADMGKCRDLLNTVLSENRLFIDESEQIVEILKDYFDFFTDVEKKCILNERTLVFSSKEIKMQTN